MKNRRSNYMFRAFSSNGREIKIKVDNIIYNSTEHEAQCVRWGIETGLRQMYKCPIVEMTRL